jgi:hypothetical protein
LLKLNDRYFETSKRWVRDEASNLVQSVLFGQGVVIYEYGSMVDDDQQGKSETS